MAIEIFADGAAVDQNCAGGRVVDAGDQADQRGLARAGGADDGQAAAGGDAQVQVVQDLFAFVAEVQIAEFDFAGDVAGLRFGRRL